MAETQILSVIDCKSILDNVHPGTIGNEKSLGAWNTSDQFVFMVASGDYLASDQGKSELNVGVHSGDIVQWSVTDPTSGQEYSPVLYGFTTGQTAAITPPEMISAQLNVYQPQNLANPTGPFVPVPYPDYIWQTTIRQPGVQVQYSWKFCIIDNNGTNLGAYTWDPFITVK